MTEKGLLLKIVTPTGETANLACDSVHVQVPDDVSGNNGGWVGIRRGHVDSLLALEPGELQALRDGAVLARYTLGQGFAFVQDDTVTVITDQAETKE